MAVPTLTNRYRFPNGYRGYVAFSGGGSFVPWNGYNNGVNTPNSAILGAVVEIVPTGAPADLQVMVIGTADGKFYRFQFLYAGTPGNDPTSIEVQLPNSGLSTGAEVMTALLGVINAASAFTEGGNEVLFPWIVQLINPTTVRLNFTSSIAVIATFGVTNVTITAIAQPTLGYSGIGASHGIPGTIGKLGAFLPGP